jgi:preprotein translocase subunit SecA
MSGKFDDKSQHHFERKREEKKRQQEGLPGEDEAPLPPPVEPIKKAGQAPGRNDPCPCGSGKKFKQCCMKKDK